MKTNLKVGDKLYAMVAPRHGRASVLTEVEISKIGRKFIYANENDYQIDKESLECIDARRYPRPRRFYETEQELLNINNILRMRQEINNMISYSNLKATDDQIKAIHKILFPDDDENRTE